MEENMRMDIRRLLKSFGIQADERIIAHIARNPGATPLRVRITLEDLTTYEDDAPGQPLTLEIEGEIRRN